MIYYVELSLLMIAVMIFKPQLDIVCNILPLLGEKILIVSSFQPLIMYLPFLEKWRDSQIILGNYILRIGVSILVFQITIYPPAAVPNTSEKSLRIAKALILVQWEVYISWMLNVKALNL